jgi:hypothetical protein
MHSAANLRSTFFATASAAVVLLLSIAASAQSLPPNLPTALAQPPASPTNCLQPPCNATLSAAPAATRPHRATVTFADGQLTVAANDSSLHQILRNIAVSTGMTINGGVAEQRVFGTYGPDDPSTVLATLLDGTGVNMLLKDGPTPQDDQIGLDTPPPAAAPQPVAQPQPSRAATPPAPSTSVPASIPQPANNVLGNPNNTTPTASQIPTTNSVPLDAIPTPSTTVQTQQGIVDTPNPPPAGSTSPTADSIYQQLLQLQKAKAAAGSPAAPSTTPPPQ